jgi:hypothetical protein
LPLIILFFANLSNFFFKLVDSLPGYAIIPRMVNAERDHTLSESTAGVRKTVEIPDKQAKKFKIHGLAIIPVIFPLGQGQKPGVYEIDLSLFENAKFAWLKNLKEEGFDIIISNGKQTPPKQSYKEDEQTRRHGQLLELNPEEKIAVTSVRYRTRALSSSSNILSYRPSLLHDQ